MALKATFERVIDKAYHTTGNTGIMGDSFGQLTHSRSSNASERPMGEQTYKKLKRNYST